ncbi:MAG: hypothetical protein QXN87_05830 [Candidatus Bathyarchaeia archaeon]
MRKRKAASPAISMVIITATTIVLVLVASSYAYQVLERQRGASEFETVKKSFATFDDAVRDVAWDREGKRSARFTVKYGVLEIVPDNPEKGLPLTVQIQEYPEAQYSTFTGYIRYNISTNYVTFGYPYKSYLFGDEKTAINKTIESYGAALIEQKFSMVSLTLYYRVRVAGTSLVKVNDSYVNYVDIMIIKITAKNTLRCIDEFDLVATNKGITTRSFSSHNFTGSTCNVMVNLGELTGSTSISLDHVMDPEGKKEVVFNFIVAEIEVGV